MSTTSLRDSGFRETALRSSAPFRATLLVVFMLLVSLMATSGAGAAEDELSPQDHDDLIHHLNIIANNPWPPDSVSAANAILTRPQYSVLAWHTFFTEYFTDYTFTDYLEGYLGYPAFWWFDDVVHAKLQTGLHQPLLLQNVDPDWQAASSGPDTIFGDDPLLRQDLFNSMRFLTMIGPSDVVQDATRQAIYDHMLALPGQHPTVLMKPVTFDRDGQPYFGIMRAQTYMAIIASAGDLDAARKSEIASAILLVDDYEDLWLDHSLLFLENNLTDEAQRQFVDDYLGVVPADLHNLRSITINDLLGNTTTHQGRTYGLATAYGGVNIFGVPIGYYHEDSFPNDVPPGIVDGYCVVVAHEVNHVVDAYKVGGDPVLAARRQALIDGAGCDSMNYLRSMFNDCFFVDAPQEFFASISNQWFTDSAKTIELGLVRFDAGRPDPINQALFFVDVYSLGGDNTHFYTVDVAGNWTHETVPITRDGNGHIDGMTFDGTRYTFYLDDDGNVINYAADPACIGDLNGDGNRDQGDLGVLLASFGLDGGGDIDGDGDTDQADLGLLLAVYDMPCP